MDKQLKPCPFCGGNFAEYDLYVDEYVIEKQYTVVCNAQKGGCGASCGYSYTKRDAKKKWNRRVNNG